MLNYCSSVNVLRIFLGFCKGEGRADMLHTNAQLTGFI